MSYNILRTSNENPDFINLIKQLDQDLYERYGDLQKQYESHNKVDFVKDVIVIFKENLPVACGAYKVYDHETVELKRMFVVKENRRQGFAKRVVAELEELARGAGFKFMVLETGEKQYEAIHLYQSYGFEIIPNYGPYKDNKNSVCMRKAL